jgi:hypothetical protein
MSPPPVDDETVRKLVTDQRWKTLVRVEEPLVSIAKWDKLLLRQPRVLVPIDVQALYVPKGSDETFVRLPFAMTTPDGKEPEPMPQPFDDGVKRPAGVHLHWAMPDSLLDGTLTDRDRGAENRLSLPPLPDRWVVLRLAVPREATRAVVSGWVIEADRTTVTPLADWPSPGPTGPPTGKSIAPDLLTGTVGGSLSWSGCYDAVANRFAFHDPLDDLRATFRAGVLGDFATYLVCGWWNDPRRDPLDVAQSKAGLRSRLDALKWRLTDDLDDRGASVKKQATKQKKQSAASLTSAARYKTLSAAIDPTTIGNEVKPAAAAALGGLFAETASHFATAVTHDPYASLLHGVIHGVPVAGEVVADQRPAPDRARTAFGFHADDIAAIFAATGLSMADPDDRRDVERLVSGFTHDLLSGVGTANGIFAIEEGEHVAGFSSRPGEPGPTERVISPAPSSELPGTRAERSAMFGTLSKKTVALMETELLWSSSRPASVKSFTADRIRTVREKRDAKKAPPSPPASRLVQRPTPRYFEPMEPMLAVSGGGRSARHRFDDKRSPDGRLQCRWPSQVPDEIAGLIKGAALVSGYPAGGLPPEVVRLVESAMILDPYLAPWRVEVASKATGFDAAAVKARMFAETALRFSRDARFGVGVAARSPSPTTSPYHDARVAAGLNRFSLIAGVDSDPVGVTAWSQPWVPMWLEWEVEVDTADRLDGWALGPVDLESGKEDNPPGGSVRTIAGRSPLNSGVAATLGNAISEWLKAEDARGADGEVSDAVEKELSDIAHAVSGIDILSANLDSLHDVLLGLPVGPYGVLQPRNGGTVEKPTPVSIPELLLAGRLRVRKARLVDAFGRTLDLDPDSITYPARDDIPGGVTLRPRLLRPARWMFRLVDPADLSGNAREATIDQLEPSLMINPVAGFLLPDHIDEALEVFDTAGAPIGQLFHDPISGGVTWEIAPGRDGPPDAGPLYNLQPAQQLLGQMSAAIVAKDAETRAGLPASEDTESALSALLRAIDTTLWSVDTYAVLGATHVAGLVGRPIAVVRATLRLDILDDLGELDLSNLASRAEREAAYAGLADRAFAVRIGEITRDDDGVLGFFVDDDFTRFHVVDKVVRDAALDAGRGRGQLGLLGQAPQVPEVKPITHPYIVAEDELTVRPGQTLRLTLLLHPGGKCHLTSGILPRKSLQLSRDWIHDGLAAIEPSARIGPVLIDSEKVRLPLIASFGTEQLWTRRDNNFTWKNDPILAATQTALLPLQPAKVEEGYIRVAPVVRDSEQ